MKYSFKNDYSEGVHPRILQKLVETNLTQEPGYGLDQYSTKAKQFIKERLKSETAEIYFTSGGTQANLLVIASILRPYESVISPETGHIFTNEAGAIEATGHKVHGIKSPEGKISCDVIEELLEMHTNVPHQVQPKLVYISNSTELGTLYSKKELSELYAFCQKKNLFLFIDGARLGQALTAEPNDLEFSDLAKLCDALYIGGTKNGALMGEAIVLLHPEIQKNFGFILKQRGALLAKGRALGVQFLTLFEDQLFFDLASHANQMAMKLKNAFLFKGYSFLSDTYTNQLFPILKLSEIEKLEEDFEFYRWKKIEEDRYAIRLITSWATRDEKIEEFIAKLHHL